MSICSIFSGQSPVFLPESTRVGSRLLVLNSRNMPVLTSNARFAEISIVRQVMKLCWQPFDVQFASIISRLRIHSQAVHDEIEVLQTATIIRTCQLELQQLSLAQTNTCTLAEIKGRQQELQETLKEAVDKQEEARAVEENKFCRTMSEHLKQVKLAMDLLSLQGFGKTTSSVTTPSKLTPRLT